MTTIPTATDTMETQFEQPYFRAHRLQLRSGRLQPLLRVRDLCESRREMTTNRQALIVGLVPLKLVRFQFSLFAALPRQCRLWDSLPSAFRALDIKPSRISA